jgi:hypothetical protein
MSAAFLLALAGRSYVYLCNGFYGTY